MADTLTKRQRSFCMSRIKGKWTKPELAVHNMLKGRKIRHIMHPAIDGSPDIIFKDKKVAVFIHGCFWHGCPKCFIKPASNKAYWSKKIAGNRRRDKNNVRRLKKAGWNVIVIWEHETRNSEGINKLLPI